MARLPNLAPLQGLAQAPANTSLPSVPTPPQSVYHKEGGKLGNSPAACRQLRIIRPVAHRADTACLPGPSLLRLLAVPEDSRASQPPPLRDQQELRTEEGNKAKIWRPELGAGSQGPEAALDWPSPQSHLLIPGLSCFRDPAGDRGGVVYLWAFPAQQLPSLAMGDFHNRSLLGCWGLATGSSADPSDVSSGFAFEEPVDQDFKGLPWPTCVPKPAVATAPGRGVIPGSAEALERERAGFL